MSILNCNTCLRLTCLSGRSLKKGTTVGQLDWRPVIGSRRYAKDCKGNENSTGNILQELRTRGLVNSTTSDTKLFEHLQQGKITAYVGLDPTAESLHLGNLMTLMPLIHLFARGHNIVPLIGGFTCKIGDPSGRTTDREVIPNDISISNVSKLRTQVDQFFQVSVRKYVASHGYKENAVGTISVLNNMSWWDKFSLADFMYKIARNIRVSRMMARDSVKTRLASDEGLDAASFLYQSLQAYDFVHLYQTRKCTLQIGGSDQWGNILAGIDLLHSISPPDSNPTAFGLTVPLLLSPSGDKFGKTAGNAIFLDPNLTHPFDLYQYFLRTFDDHAAQYLNIFTLLPLERIEEIMREHVKAPEKRLAQRILAHEVITLVHRAEVTEKCIFQTAALYPAPSADSEGGNLLRSERILQAFADDEVMLKRYPFTEIHGMPISRLLKTVGLTKSNGEGLRVVQSGGIYINGVQVRDVEKQVTPDLFLDGKVMVIRFGKNHFKIIEGLTNEEIALEEELEQED